MKVVLRSVLLLPKQPFIRSATVSILGSSAVYKPEFPRSSAATSTLMLIGRNKSLLFWNLHLELSFRTGLQISGGFRISPLGLTNACPEKNIAYF
ncbi:hypothetical protein R6Q59_022883 [Mikania micrantha]